MDRPSRRAIHPEERQSRASKGGAPQDERGKKDKT